MSTLPLKIIIVILAVIGLTVVIAPPGRCVTNPFHQFINQPVWVSCIDTK